MSKKIIINIIALFLIGNVFAQNRILKGQIVDEKFEPLPFAAIKTTYNEKNFVADKLGYFEIEIAESEKEIETYYVGQISEKINIERNATSILLCYATT